jgi:hypothetical protein
MGPRQFAATGHGGGDEPTRHRRISSGRRRVLALRMTVLRAPIAFDPNVSAVVAPRVMALVCDAVGTSVDIYGNPARSDGAHQALCRARAGGVRVAFVHDEWPREVDLRDAFGRGDVIVVPQTRERTTARRNELRPELVRRTCDLLGVDPVSCVVIGGRRPLLAAAAWTGARTVMVPNDATPLFDVRAMRCVAPDLATAIDAAVITKPGPS